MSAENIGYSDPGPRLVPHVWYPPDTAALVAPLKRVWRFRAINYWPIWTRPTPLSDAIVEHGYRSRLRG